MALSYKTLALWRLTEERFEADYVIKVDDDNYVRLDRLAIALGQWADMGAGLLMFPPHVALSCWWAVLQWMAGHALQKPSFSPTFVMS